MAAYNDYDGILKTSDPLLDGYGEEFVDTLRYAISEALRKRKLSSEDLHDIYSDCLVDFVFDHIGDVKGAYKYLEYRETWDFGRIIDDWGDTTVLDIARHYLQEDLEDFIAGDYLAQELVDELNENEDLWRF